MEMIKPIKNNIIINNGERIVRNFWIKQENSKLKNDNNLFLCHSQLREAIKLITRKCIYIQTNKELDYEFIEVLNNLWTRGINIYLLTNKLYNSYKDTIVGKALIRYSDNIVGDLVLIDANTIVAKGLISDDSEFSEKKKYFELNVNQIKECFEMFVYKFWKKTDFECIDEQTFISPIETQEAPFDIFPKLNSKSIISDDYLSGNIINKLEQFINSAKNNITLITNNVDMNDILIQKIADKENNVKVEVITNIKRGLQEIAPLFYPIELYDIYGSKNELYPMIILDNSVAIIFTKEVKSESLLNSFCIINTDKIALEKIISYKNELISNEKTYYYYNEIKLKEIIRKNIVTDINNISSSIKMISEVEYIKGESEICESLTYLYNKVSKRNVTFNNKYAKMINYSYDLVPKYRNEAFNKDKLYDTWKVTYDNIAKYSEKLISEIESVVSDNSSLFLNIMSIFDTNRVNSKQTIKELNNIVTEITNKNYSIYNLKEFDRILKKAYNDYIELNSDVSQMKDYKEQLEKWKSKKASIESDIDEVESKLSSKEKEIYQVEVSLLNNTIVELEEEILVKEVELQEIKENIINERKSLKLYFERIDVLNAFNKSVSLAKLKKKKDIDKVVDKTKETVNFIFNDKEYFDSVYKNRINNAKNPAGLTALIKNIILSDLNEFIIKDLSEIDNIGLETLDNLKKEIDVLNEKLREEKNKSNSNNLNKKLSALQKELSNLENQKIKLNSQLQQLGGVFEYKASNKETKELKVKKFGFKLIDEELPKVGILYSNKNTKQLAIKYWDELNLGIKEAERLNAELVCEI